MRLSGAHFLNDLAFAPDGRVLIADSQNARIYAINPTRRKSGPDALLDSVNGLYAEPAARAWTTHGRAAARDRLPDAFDQRARRGLGDADGIAPLGNGNYLVSEWPGLMHVVAATAAIAR